MKFVTLTRSAFFDENQENPDTQQLNAKTKKKIDKLLKEQDDEQYLKSKKMPKVCKGMPYEGPVVATHGTGGNHGNNFVVTNETHTRSTNNGFARSDGGSFYCH